MDTEFLLRVLFVMPTDATPLLYDLGQHTLEITQEHTTHIAIYMTGNGPLPEIVQLDGDETYRLFSVLKEMFQ